MIGQTLSHYEVVEKLGEGGMGVVYRALDTRLNRQVAIKILPSTVTDDPERAKRFVQEARAASALNHPNIITVYDVDTARLRPARGAEPPIASERGPQRGSRAGVPGRGWGPASIDDAVTFIAMELVEGRTLEQLIGRKGLKLTDALRCAVQIADALAAAHAAGIVHRDLKPGNVMVTAAGRVKVLDFGLAKSTERTESDEAALTRTSDADIRPRTEEGAILGTVAYMSPEQAEGKRVDARSDIFSFGSLLYEMVTGRRPFQGDSKIATLSAILHKEPTPASEIVEGVPRELDRIIAHCLRKDATRRFQHLDDVKTLLEELKEESESGKLAASSLSVRAVAPRRLVPLGVAAVLLAGTAAGVTWWLAHDRSPRSGQASTPIRLTFDSGLTTDPALSPDGKLVAYASDRAGADNLDIWVQNVAGGEANHLTADEADEREPTFSPDGSKIAFRSEKDGGGIYVVPTIGGRARLVAPRGRRPRFSPDGTQIAYYVGLPDVWATVGAALYVVGSTGGEPRRVECGVTDATYPVWTPDGRHLLFIGFGPQAVIDWWVAPAQGGKATRTGAFDVFRRRQLRIEGFDVLVATPSSWLGNDVVFAGQIGTSRSVWRVPISPDTWQVTDGPQRLTTGTSVEVQPTLATAPDEGGRSRTRLVFSSLTSTLNIWALPTAVNQGKVTGSLQQLTFSEYDSQLSLSGDGKRLVFASNRSGNLDIWLKDLESGRETPLTVGPSDEFLPEIVADGTKVFYHVTEQNSTNIYAMPLGQGGQPGVPQRVCSGCEQIWDASSDGSKALFIYALQPNLTVGLLEPSSGRKVEWLKHSQYSVVRLRFSPDDRWVSLLTMEKQGARSRLYVVPFRDGAPRAEASTADWIAVTDGESFEDKPVWSPDGNLLYFFSDRDGFRCFWAQRLDPGTKRPVGPAVPVYHFHSARRSLMNADVLRWELAVAPDKLVFHLGEITGNIWMATLSTP